MRQLSALAMVVTLWGEGAQVSLAMAVIICEGFTVVFGYGSDPL